MGLTRWISDIELQASGDCPSTVCINRDCASWWFRPRAWHASLVTATPVEGHAGSASRVARYTTAHMASSGTFAAGVTAQSRASLASEAFNDEDR